MVTRPRRRPWKPPHTATAPTPERRRKGLFGWVIRLHPGEQVSHQPKTALDAVRKQLDPDEVKALEDFTTLATSALRGVTICSRTYEGMPYTGSNGGVIGHIPQSQRPHFIEFCETLALMLHARFVRTAAVMVLGIENERNGRPMSLEEFGATLQRWQWTDGRVYKGAAAQAISDTAAVIQIARFRYRAGERADDRLRKAVREAFEHGRQVERYAHADEVVRKQRLVAQVETFFKLKKAKQITEEVV